VLELRDARHFRTTVDPRDRPSPSRPEIAFVGRSNVGKSSLLNALTRRKRLAHTSRTPGKTQTINYFVVDDACYFVDLPGYGYAAVPERVRRTWKPMIEGYLDDNPRLRGVVALVDGRHPPTPLDRRMVGWLADRGVPTLVVLTKADRVAHGRREPGSRQAVDALGLDPEQVLWFSSRSGEGRDDLMSALSDLLEEKR
jgi:GTP-binding protein